MASIDIERSRELKDGIDYACIALRNAADPDRLRKGRNRLLMSLAAGGFPDVFDRPELETAALAGMPTHTLLFLYRDEEGELGTYVIPDASIDDTMGAALRTADGVTYAPGDTLRDAKKWAAVVRVMRGVGACSASDFESDLEQLGDRAPMTSDQIDELPETLDEFENGDLDVAIGAIVFLRHAM
jgi:hypothetical protein